MKIIEALKELPLLEKRIEKNIALIREYSSDLDRGDETDLPFVSKEAQKKEVDSLIQSTEDLIKRKGSIRRALAITNSSIDVEINGMKLTITEWIEMREKGLSRLVHTQQALNDSNAQQKLQRTQVDLQKGVRTLRFYDEKERNDKISSLLEIQGMIDARLEMVNATTDMMGI